MLDGARATLDFETTAQAALAACPGLVQQWLPGGKLAGAEYEIGDVQGNPGSSLKINVKTGRWADFAADLSGGDLIAQRPAQPIPPTWPERIARHAWRAGLVRGRA